MSEKSAFDYTYVALTNDEKREVLSIRKRYMNCRRGNSELAEAIALDKKIKTFAKTVSLIAGIVGLFVFGTGLTMILEWSMLIAGIAVSVIGAIAMICAYPIHAWLLRSGKKKYGERIVALTEKFLSENKR